MTLNQIFSISQLECKKGIGLSLILFVSNFAIPHALIVSFFESLKHLN